jgi:hypothetical protein
MLFQTSLRASLRNVMDGFVESSCVLGLDTLLDRLE